MSAVAEKRPAPRTPAQLKEQLATYEQRLSAAQRLQGSTRAALSNYLTAGEELEANEARGELGKIGTAIRDLTETISALRSAIEHAETAVSHARDRKAYTAYERAVAAVRDEMALMEDHVTQFCESLVRLRTALFSKAALVAMENGLPPDRSNLSLRLDILVERKLFVASEYIERDSYGASIPRSLLGAPHGLNNAHQLRKWQGPATAGADLARAGLEYYELATLTARRKLGLGDGG